MKGLRLILVDDKGAWPGSSFWRCFAPLRAQFDQHHWLVLLQPWMGPPRGFHESGAAIDFHADQDTELMLWRPSALGRWAEHFAEESLDLAALPLDADAVALAGEYCRTSRTQSPEAFVAAHAEFFIRYTDGARWEIYARQEESLDALRQHLHGNAAIRCDALQLSD